MEQSISDSDVEQVIELPRADELGPGGVVITREPEPEESAGTRVDQLVEDAIRYTWRQGTIKGTRAERGPIAVSGDGVRVTDMEGKVYLDGLGGGSAAATLGYGRSEVSEAVAEQMTRLHYISQRTFLNEPAIQLAKAIAEVCPGDLETSFFVSSGSEAVDTATQIVKAYHKQKGQTKRTKFLYRQASFHGVSIIGASASTSAEFRDWFQPLVPDFYQVPACYAYRRPEGQDAESYGLECANAIEAEILRQGPETVAGLLAESIPAPLVLPPPPSYLKRLREICTKYDVLWIDDEVFIGFGRTGKYFGCQHYDVVPDIITSSKGITAGMIPLGAAVVSRRVTEVLAGDGGAGQARVQMHTYGGHAAASAGGLAVLKILKDENLIENVQRLGDRMEKAFLEFAENHPNVGDVRIKGFLIGIELVKDKETREPFPNEWGVGRKIVHVTSREGFLCRSARDVVGQAKGFVAGDVITFFPSFVATERDIDEMVDKTTRAIVEVCGDLPH